MRTHMLADPVLDAGFEGVEGLIASLPADEKVGR